MNEQEKQSSVKWELDETPPSDASRNIDHSRHGHRVLIGSRGDAVRAVFGNFPSDADDQADAYATLIIRAVNSFAAMKAVCEMADMLRENYNTKLGKYDDTAVSELIRAAAKALEGAK